MLTVVVYPRHLFHTTRYFRIRVGIGLLNRQWLARLLQDATFDYYDTIGYLHIDGKLSKR
jgi:hypothetical protein